MAKKIKICLDAGHYGKYNQSPVNKKYYESDMNWKLHNYLKTELVNLGIDVVVTRASQNMDLDVYKRGQKAKGCDFFISLHSNASSDPNAEYAVVCCLINDDTSTLDEKSIALGEKLAELVNNTMGSKQEWRTVRRKGNYNADYYGVLRGAKSVGVPCILLEHCFHTNKKNTTWLLKDSNLKKMAKAEAELIAKHFKVKAPVKTTSTTTTTIYRVRKNWNDTATQLGAFTSLANAKSMADKNAGYKVYDTKGKIVYEGKKATTYFKVPTYKGSSFVDALKSIGVNSSFIYRFKIANKNGIILYRGSSNQNTKLFDLLKKGKLIKP